MCACVRPCAFAFVVQQTPNGETNLRLTSWVCLFLSGAHSTQLPTVYTYIDVCVSVCITQVVGHKSVYTVTL